MIRSLIVAAALAVTAGPLVAATPDYRATLTTPVVRTIVTDGAVWACGADGCVGGQVMARPAVACAQLAREAGTVARFEGLDEAALTKCNSRARKS